MVIIVVVISIEGERIEAKDYIHLYEKPCKQVEEFFVFVRKKLVAVIPRVFAPPHRYFAKSLTVPSPGLSMARNL